jgi:hypothetical protein
MNILTMGRGERQDVLRCSRSNDLSRGDMRDYQNLAFQMKDYRAPRIKESSKLAVGNSSRPGHGISGAGELDIIAGLDD